LVERKQPNRIYGKRTCRGLQDRQSRVASHLTTILADGAKAWPPKLSKGVGLSSAASPNKRTLQGRSPVLVARGEPHADPTVLGQPGPRTSALSDEIVLSPPAVAMSDPTESAVVLA
jgi:hypothetical protein